MPKIKSDWYAVEYSLDGGHTWNHGKSIERWVVEDRGALRLQRQHVVKLAREWHGNVERVVTRLTPEE